jgi:hypothetical protein
VYPQGDLIIYEEGSGHGWMVEATKAASDLQTSNYVHSGSISHAITLGQGGKIDYLFEDPEGFSIFGYAHLEFYFHPGAASIQSLTVAVVMPTGREVVLESLGMDVERKQWQQVQIQLPDEVKGAGIRLLGTAEGTFYIDDMKLVAMELPAPVAVEVLEGKAVPSGYTLSQNIPNPFNPLTTIAYDLPKPSDVTLTIYTITGQKVATMVSGRQEAGYYRVTWDGSGFGTGIYLYRLEAGSFAETKRMVVLR